LGLIFRREKSVRGRVVKCFTGVSVAFDRGDRIVNEASC
jgi:hypothetical protein